MVQIIFSLGVDYALKLVEALENPKLCFVKDKSAFSYKLSHLNNTDCLLYVQGRTTTNLSSKLHYQAYSES